MRYRRCLLLILALLASSVCQAGADQRPRLRAGEVFCTNEGDLATYWQGPHDTGWRTLLPASCRALKTAALFSSLALHMQPIARTEVQLLDGPKAGAIGWVIGAYGK